DLSRDLAAALLEALDAEPGTAITAGVTAEGPRLQDVLDLTAPFEVTVHDTYGAYWNEEDAEEDEEADTETLPTVRLTAIDHAYLTTMNKPFLRWARPEDEDDVVAAIARLHAKRESAVQIPGGEGRFLGYFRAVGLTVPVWEFPDGTEAKDLEGPMAEYAERFEAALQSDAPLDANERRAKAGIVSRQVTLR
ncbi:MAG: DUF5926 family protein, partial [Promicromonosporaceae bacterium]|nr:DUF5926 family protein [Promicromonosporaceae bacterium]